MLLPCYFFLKTSKQKRIQTFFCTIKLHFSSYSPPRPSWGSNCLLLCQGSRHFWHCYYCSSPRRTTPRIAVYHFDKLHYSSNTILSRPQTVPSALRPNLGDALVFFPISPTKDITFFRGSAGAQWKRWLDNSWQVRAHKQTQKRMRFKWIFCLWRPYKMR